MSYLSKPKTIYIDCTNTYYDGLNTGIQRVVRNIVYSVSREDLTRSFEIPCVPIIFAYGYAWKISGFPPKWLYVFKDRYSSFKKKIKKIIKKRASDIFGGPVAENQSEVTAGQDNVRQEKKYRKPLSLIRKSCAWAQLVLVLPFLKIRGLAKISSSDLLLAPDAFWPHNVTIYIENISKRDVSIVPLIYDLIPVSHPEYVANDNCQMFNAFLDSLLLVSDGVIGISKTTKNDVLSYIKLKHDSKYNKIKVDYFYLGSDFEKENKFRKKEKVRNWPEGLWKDGEVYLMVGTIEARKGYDFLFDAFKRMWSEGLQAKLLIVGKRGWKCENVIARIENSPNQGSKLFVFHDINDDELSYCYKHATALIFASRVEGFGLPLVEAMEKGLPVIASDIPVFREIGGDYPVYFSLDNMESLRQALLSVSKRKFTRKSWISWDEAVITLLNKAVSIFDARNKRGNIG